jgi:3-oxoacyl-[acyl-carrier protein] reductase
MIRSPATPAPGGNSIKSYLDGKRPRVALVTGAGRGIGRALAVALGERGATVWCVSRTQNELQTAAAEVDRAGGRGVPRVGDVTDLDEMARICRQVADEAGRLDIVVANAGTNLDRRSVEESNPDDFRKTLEINLFGVYNVVKAAIPLLKASGGGHVVVIGSGLGARGTAGSGAYAASKAGAHVLVQTLSAELGPLGIVVNELIPGPVRTELTRPLWETGRGVFGLDEWIKEPEDVVPFFLTILDRDPAESPSGQTFSLTRRVL